MDSGDSGEDEHQCQTTPRGRARRATAGQGTRRSTDATHTKGYRQGGATRESSTGAGRSVAVLFFEQSIDKAREKRGVWRCRGYSVVLFE